MEYKEVKLLESKCCTMLYDTGDLEILRTMESSWDLEKIGERLSRSFSFIILASIRELLSASLVTE